MRMILKCVTLQDMFEDRQSRERTAAVPMLCTIVHCHILALMIAQRAKTMYHSIIIALSQPIYLRS